MPRKKSGPNFCITRIDYDKGANSTHGWQVRIQRNKMAHSRLFSDNVYGSKQKSLEAAREHRDEYMRENPPMTRLELAQIEKKSNKSGVVGVSKVKHVDQRNTKKYVYWYWQAYWTPATGRHRCVRYSINRYGDETAYQMAVAARYKGLAEMEEIERSKKK